MNGWRDVGMGFIVGNSLLYDDKLNISPVQSSNDDSLRKYKQVLFKIDQYIYPRVSEPLVMKP